MVGNIPKIKVGIVAVSRDCFPASLAENRRKALVAAYAKKYDAADIYECPVTIIESEIDMVNALADIKKAECNALCVYLGNFGPEISETLLAKHFDENNNVEVWKQCLHQIDLTTLMGDDTHARVEKMAACVNHFADLIQVNDSVVLR